MALTILSTVSCETGSIGTPSVVRFKRHVVPSWRAWRAWSSWGWELMRSIGWSERAGYGFELSITALGGVRYSSTILGASSGKATNFNETCFF
ncbi:hypothetical protein FGO68_gene10906 [Halteria grandinella]|uniref:Uncharacterized protein n=1 Tax=Halteria grandinella TaxID=5974 RepID=A0A8J8T5Y2_HALGN|nr:hypothetical protein FGO68_gene10906 [Halteria grandinella]